MIGLATGETSGVGSTRLIPSLLRRAWNNTKEEGLPDDEQVEPQRLASNANEDALEDDDVEAHDA